MASDRVTIPGSELTQRAGDRVLPAVVDSQSVTVTVLVRRNPKAVGPSQEDLLSGNYQAPAGRSPAQAVIAADPADVAAVRAFAEQYGLKVIAADAPSRRVQLEGSASSIGKAFGVQLRETETSGGRQFLTYTGAISVPRNLGGVVTAVLGLDQRAVAAPRE